MPERGGGGNNPARDQKSVVVHGWGPQALLPGCGRPTTGTTCGSELLTPPGMHSLKRAIAHRVAGGTRTAPDRPHGLSIARASPTNHRERPTTPLRYLTYEEAFRCPQKRE